MARGGICGIALCAAAAVLAGGATTAAARPCKAVRHVGAVTAVGCWTRTGTTWRAPTPVTLNGLTLADGKGVVVDEHKGTIVSKSGVRWRFGAVQIRKAPFAWHRGTKLTVPLTGGVRGLAFRGGGSIAFTGAKGGTTQLTTTVLVPLVAGGLSGDVVLSVSRNAGFDLKHLHVTVPQAPLSRLVFKKLDFGYDMQGGRWYGQGEVTLPAFSSSGVTITGHIGLANGKIVDVGVGADGLQIPLADGFFLTGAAFSAGFDPFGLAGSASVTFGPPLGTGAALKLVGRGEYVGQPERWTASGKLTLPWLAQFTPTVDGSVSVRPGRAVTFDADVNLTIHGWGLTSHLDGFVSRRAFNAEGDASLAIPGPDVHGSGLFSSKGMAACGRVFFGARLGFGYSWGGALDFMHSSCDVGRWRVKLPVTRALAAATVVPTIDVPPGLRFEVFAARGSDFTVTGPVGTVASTPDRNGPDAFVTHDLEDGWAFVVLPVPPAATYVIAAVAGGTIAEVAAADGITDPTISGSVTGSGDQRTLQYGIGGLVPGETVSFYQGQSSTTAGAEPIVEDVAADGGGSVQFTPEQLGQSTRFVYAVVSVDGRPRQQLQIASFDSAEAPTPVSLVRIFRDPSKPGWTVTYAQSANVTEWQAIIEVGIVQAKRVSRTLTVPPYETFIAASPAQRVLVRMTPYDGFGRAGDAVLCDSTAPGLCPAAPPPG
jgi:hypothetical protein